MDSVKFSSSKKKLIIFDFDGVILDSMDIKAQAFVDVLSEVRPLQPREAEYVKNYHFENGGKNRSQKFEHYVESLNLPVGRHYEHLFGERVTQLLLTSDYVPGAREFISTYSAHYKFYVASGAPHEELIHLLTQRHFEQNFVEIYGYPHAKTWVIHKALKDWSYEPSSAFMVGDSMTDYSAAMTSGVDFVGVVRHSPNPFPKNTLCIKNLMELETLL